VSQWGSLAFEVAEYRRRTHAVQAILAARDIDALLCHDFPNICYLTGMESVLWTKYFLAIVPREGDPILLSQEFELPNALYSVWTEDRVGYDHDLDPIEVTRDLLVSRGLADKRLGLEKRALRVPLYERLTASLPQATLTDAGDIVDQVKMIKSAPEIAHLRRAAGLTDKGMSAALAVVAEGASDQAIAAAAYSALIGGGSEYMALDPIVTVGPRSGIPHSTHRRTRISRGDTVLIELGANIHRYTAASFRTAVVGPPNEQIRFMSEACLASLNTLISHMKPGASTHDVALATDEAWPEAITRFVWHGIYAYSLGIGFPIDWNDCPVLIQRGVDIELKPGMVFHCTTSLRDPAKSGTAFSETVLITETGAEVLTGVPRELVVA
jgi:Xaa-Pro dipeptidase